MIAAVPSAVSPGSLLVFSDDWGRHPSSCQHLVRALLDRYPVTWVNTIGTRTPRLNAATARRVQEKFVQWLRRSRPVPVSADGPCSEPAGLTVLNPAMWPWFGRTHDRRLNRWLLNSQLTPVIQRMPQPVVALTTLPITADLPGLLPVERWVYYCVDDFSVWPGLDGTTLQRLDEQMMARADALIAVSETLQDRIAHYGRPSELLTHGVDLAAWQAASPATTHHEIASLLSHLPRPLVVFWGVVDRRLDTASLAQLSRDLDAGSIVLVGPQQDPDPHVMNLPRVAALPAQPLGSLREIARQSDVLIMPYADLPVTRAMQPLKLKEYLATGRPVVVNRLPSTAPWSDCLDTAESPAQFSQLVCLRLRTAPPASQQASRMRLASEGWAAKARLLENVLRGEIMGSTTTAAGLPTGHVRDTVRFSDSPGALTASRTQTRTEGCR